MPSGCRALQGTFVHTSDLAEGQELLRLSRLPSINTPCSGFRTFFSASFAGFWNPSEANLVLRVNAGCYTGLTWTNRTQESCCGLIVRGKGTGCRISNYDHERDGAVPPTLRPPCLCRALRVCASGAHVLSLVCTRSRRSPCHGQMYNNTSLSQFGCAGCRITLPCSINENSVSCWNDYHWPRAWPSSRSRTMLVRRGC